MYKDLKCYLNENSISNNLCVSFLEKPGTKMRFKHGGPIKLILLYVISRFKNPE